MLSESKTGYCWAMKPYCGESATLKQTVLFLMEGLEDVGYRLWMDNYYNSLGMCQVLLSLGTHCCGTLRVNRHGPKDIHKLTHKDLEIGDRKSLHTGGDVMVVGWRLRRLSQC